MKRIPILVFVLAVIVAATGISSGLRISGAIWNENVVPGDSIAKEISIGIGPEEKPVDFTIEVEGMGQTLQGINTPLSADNDISPYTATPYLTITPVSFSLEPGESQTVTAEAEIPEDIGSGTRYAIISLRSLDAAPSSEKSESSQVGVSVGSNIPVVLTIEGSELHKNGEITALNIDESLSPSQQDVSVILRNTGNTHYSAIVKAELRDEVENVLAEAVMDTGVQAIVPTFSRLFELSLFPTASLEPGPYEVIVLAELEDGTVLDSDEIHFEISP